MSAAGSCAESKAAKGRERLPQVTAPRVTALRIGTGAPERTTAKGMALCSAGGAKATWPELLERKSE